MIGAEGIFRSYKVKADINDKMEQSRSNDCRCRFIDTNSEKRDALTHLPATTSASLQKSGIFPVTGRTTPFRTNSALISPTIYGTDMSTTEITSNSPLDSASTLKPLLYLPWLASVKPLHHCSFPQTCSAGLPRQTTGQLRCCPNLSIECQHGLCLRACVSIPVCPCV